MNNCNLFSFGIENGLTYCIEDIHKQHNGSSTNETPPLISVVMSIYNANVEYLKECVDSVLGQSFKDFEFIIIDDGSTDLSGYEFIQTYNDTRIKLIYNEHNYIDSLNRAVREARGKYIARMDMDDIMLPERLQVQLDYMELNPNIDICGSWMEYIGAKSGICYCNTNHADIVRTLLVSNTLSHPTIIMRATSIQHRISYLYEDSFFYVDDYRLWTQLIMDGLIFSNIPSILLKYRIHENQITQKFNKEVFNNSLRVRLDYTQYVIETLVKCNPKTEKLFNELIDLYNDSVIDLDNLTYIVHILWNKFPEVELRLQNP